MIIPTVGRVVWFYPRGKAQADAGEQPQAAHVAYVHGDRLVNLMAITSSGVPYPVKDVRLVQPDDEAPLPQEAFACWMPYQIGAAAAKA